jgi:cobalt-zinc-cadmium efflux system membrane fusion protein
MKKISTVIIALLVISCHSGKVEKVSEDSVAGADTSRTFRCKGYFSLHPARLVTVTAPINGFIKKMYYNTGDYVKKGSLLAVLTHQDYIKIQQDYLEAKNQVDYYVEDLRRQGELTLEHASSIKRMQRAQTDYWANEARLRALKAQLDYIGIDADKVVKEGFTNTINIYAPVSGYITGVDGNTGKFIDSYAFIYEIADIEELYISFELPCMLYDKIYQNMPVKFSLSGGSGTLSGATIKSIGQVFNARTNTVNIIARPDSVNKFFRPGMNVEVVITQGENLKNQ